MKLVCLLACCAAGTLKTNWLALISCHSNRTVSMATLTTLHMLWGGNHASKDRCCGCLIKQLVGSLVNEIHPRTPASYLYSPSYTSYMLCYRYCFIAGIYRRLKYILFYCSGLNTYRMIEDSSQIVYRFIIIYSFSYTSYMLCYRCCFICGMYRRLKSYVVLLLRT